MATEQATLQTGVDATLPAHLSPTAPPRADHSCAGERECWCTACESRVTRLPDVQGTADAGAYGHATDCDHWLGRER